MPLFGPPDVEKLKARGDVAGLIRALGYGKDARIRMEAADALTTIGDARAVEPLCVALRDPDWAVQSKAAGALGNLGDPRAVEPLITASKEMDPNVRLSAIGALGRIGQVRALDAIMAGLSRLR